MFMTLLRATHLGCFGAWFGAQVWVTFFAGIIMYKHLPRHTFGYIQSKLFPKYFLLGVVLSSISLVTFVIHNHTNNFNFEQKLQVACHVVNLLAVVVNAYYLGPLSSVTMFEKHKLEKEEHAGQAVGQVEEDKSVKLRKNKRYVELEKRFSRLHGYSAMTNLVALFAQSVNVWFLASHLRTL